MDVKKGYATYHADDFILYVFSLAIIAAASIAAFQSYWLLIAIFLALAYMLIFFIVKHGVKIDWGCFTLIFKEIAFYPILVLKELIPSLWILAPIYVSYILALSAEAFYFPKLKDTFWIQPFPYITLFYVHFIFVTLFRTYILFGHLKQHTYVKNFLETSTWKQAIKGIDIRFSIVHSYITGLLTHLATLLPPLIFWRLTSPSYFRETILFIFYIILQLSYSSIKGKTKDGWPIHLDAFLRYYYKNHNFCHFSRFYFTVFHGHHHDAIPSSMLAAVGGTGLVEGMHRSLVRLHFLYSTTLLLLFKATVSVIDDIKGHQYIPGLFPYTNYSIKGGGHHPLHHYNSVLPTTYGVWPFIQDDINNGYNMANPLAQWYVESVAKHENLDPFIIENYMLPGKIHPVLPQPIIILSVLFVMT